MTRTESVYKFMCDPRTRRWNENCFVHQNVMYYVSDEDIATAKTHLVVDMMLLAELKARHKS